MGSGAGKGKQVKTAEQEEQKSVEPATHETEVLAASPDGCDALARALSDLQADSPAASDLQLSSFMIEDAGVVKLAQALAKSTRLEVLNLGINKLTDASVEALVGPLAATNIKVLNLERNGLTAVGVAALAKNMPPSLEKLLLGRNAIEAAGARALADSTVRLHTLGLGFGSLRPEGAQALVPILSKVVVLDVSGNHLGGGGCAALATNLKGSSLECLKLESNGVGDEGARALGVALGQGIKLRVLEVRRNSVTDEGAKCFARAIEGSSALNELDLFDNSITDVGATALLAALRSGKKSLKKLNLDINDISPAVKSQVAAALSA